MRKFLTLSAVAVVTAMTLATSVVPASAGGGHGHGKHHRWDNHRWERHHWAPRYIDGRFAWRSHIRWCENHYRSYDRDTDRFFWKGRWHRCRSPYI